MTDVVVAGAAGRMGSRIVACLGEARELRLVAALEAPSHPALGRDAGETAGVGRLGVALASDAAAALVRDRVLIEFSTPEASLQHLRLAAAPRAPAGLRTTRLPPKQREENSPPPQKGAVVLAPHFSVGVTVALQ